MWEPQWHAARPHLTGYDVLQVKGWQDAVQPLQVLAMSMTACHDV